MVFHQVDGVHVGPVEVGGSPALVFAEQIEYLRDFGFVRGELQLHARLRSTAKSDNGNLMVKQFARPF